MAEGSVDGSPKVLLWKRARLWAILVGIYGFLLWSVWYAVVLVRAGFHARMALDDRFIDLFKAAGLLFFPCLVAWSLLKRRLRTGMWFGRTPEEKQRTAALLAARQSGFKTGVCSKKPPSFTRYALLWASQVIDDPAADRRQSLQAWTVLALYLLFQLGLVVFGLMAIGAAFADDNRFSQTCLFLALGIAAFIYPALCLRRTVLRMQATGRIFPGQQEWEQVAGQRRAWQERERKKPLRDKVLGHSGTLILLLVFWVRAWLGHARHGHSDWVSPMSATVVWIYSVWNSFYRSGKASKESQEPAPAPEN